jgi:two-component system invasion response regulator UvrY
VRRIVEEDAPDAVVGEAATAEDALVCVREQEWDVVVLDISLGGTSGLELLTHIKLLRPALPVLMLSMHSEEQYARRAFKTGASGYIMKNSSRTTLRAAINKVHRGGRYVSPELAEALAADIGRDSDTPLHEGLSRREFEVMRLMGSGKGVVEIAGLLSLSDKTVSTYRARILEKLRLRTNADVVRYVVEKGLLM